jgi:hypothetical protein
LKSIKKLHFFPVLVHYGTELSLPHVSRHDSGVYFCLASNGVPPTVSKKVRLYVDCKLYKVTLQSIYITTEPDHLDIESGEKDYAKWALYLNKNYSYYSSKPFYHNAPVIWGEGQNVSCSIVKCTGFFNFQNSAAATCGLYKQIAVNLFAPKDRNFNLNQF